MPHYSQRRRLTAAEIQRVTELWNAEKPIAEIARELGRTYKSIQETAQRLKLQRRRPGGKNSLARTPPTPQELFDRCFFFRINWTQQERALRRVCGRRADERDILDWELCRLLAQSAS